MSIKDILKGSITFAVGVGIGVAVSSNKVKEKEKEILEEKKKLEEERKRLKQELKEKLQSLERELKLKAKEELLKEKEKLSLEYQEKKKELLELEKELTKKQEILISKEKEIKKLLNEIEEREKILKEKENMLNEELKKLEELKQEEEKLLEKIANMTKEEAKKELIKRVEEEYRQELAQKFKKQLEELEKEAEKEAQKILATTIQRLATSYVLDSTVSVVDLPNNEMKGRIIGREGRNIRAFEMATGVDLIIDDTPEAVVISCFDPVRREIARIALERLIADGRIHPARIEEVVEKVKKEVEEDIINTGEQTCLEVGILDIHPEIKKLIGRLKFRTSYGQNILEHSKEVAYIAELLASELGLDVEKCKRAAFLHDVGKAIDHEEGGSHALIGAEILKKYGESEDICDMVAAHHDERPHKSIESIIVQVADALSAARPGARRESIDVYIKRLQKLESIAESFPGVQKAYAIQAGREIRIMVEPDKILDEEAELLAHEIARKIEEEVKFPGQIKITVIREKRACDVAK